MEGCEIKAKLIPIYFDRWSVIEGTLSKCAQFADFHCLNGAVIEVPDGGKLVDGMVSHHYVVTRGHNRQALKMVSQVFDLACQGNG